MVQFDLQFPIDEVPEYAARYPYADDVDVIAIGQAARERRHYKHNEFIKVCLWKTPRSARLVELNEAEPIERMTRLALADSSTERERIESLRSLSGVDWATASVFLHLSYPDRYPILDKRALQALGVPPPSEYSFRFWESYVNACRRLAAQADVNGRTFDQALWQWSKEQGVRLS